MTNILALHLMLFNMVSIFDVHVGYKAHKDKIDYHVGIGTCYHQLKRWVFFTKKKKDDTSRQDDQEDKKDSNLNVISQHAIEAIINDTNAGKQEESI